MRNLALLLTAMFMLQTCASVPKPEDPVAECGLERSDGWELLAREPPDAGSLLEEIWKATPSRNAPYLSSAFVGWFSTADHERLAFCQYQGDRTCGFSMTSTFHAKMGKWVLDDEEIVQMCSRH